MKRILQFFRIFVPLPRVKTDKEAMQEDRNAIKKDWESVVGKDDGKNPWWGVK